jgi:hypothetical protein
VARAHYPGTTLTFSGLALLQLSPTFWSLQLISLPLSSTLRWSCRCWLRFQSPSYFWASLVGGLTPFLYRFFIYLCHLLCSNGSLVPCDRSRSSVLPLSQLSLHPRPYILSIPHTFVAQFIFFNVFHDSNASDGAACAIARSAAPIMTLPPAASFISLYSTPPL